MDKAVKLLFVAVDYGAENLGVIPAFLNGWLNFMGL